MVIPSDTIYMQSKCFCHHNYLEELVSSHVFLSTENSSMQEHKSHIYQGWCHCLSLQSTLMLNLNHCYVALRLYSSQNMGLFWHPNQHQLLCGASFPWSELQVFLLPTFHGIHQYHVLAVRGFLVPYHLNDQSLHRQKQTPLHIRVFLVTSHPQWMVALQLMTPASEHRLHVSIQYPWYDWEN